MTKKIEAIIREDRFNDVKEALRKIGIIGMNVTEVRGHGRGGGIFLTGRTGTYQVDLLPRFQFNIILSDHNVEKTINIGFDGDDIIDENSKLNVNGNSELIGNLNVYGSNYINNNLYVKNNNRN